MIVNDLYIQLHDKPKQKQEEQKEQQENARDATTAYANLMAAYDQKESVA